MSRYPRYAPDADKQIQRENETCVRVLITASDRFITPTWCAARALTILAETESAHFSSRRAGPWLTVNGFTRSISMGS
jgi:hypothetical protein